MRKNGHIIGLGVEHLPIFMKERFAQISGITESSDGTYFMVDFSANTQKMNLVVKEMDAFIRGFLAIHGDPKTAYGFNINCGRQVINNIWYNEPNYGHRIELAIKGRHQKLFLVDVLGATGDYSVFNQDFEYLGDLYMPIGKVGDDHYDHSVFPDWSKPEKWRATTKLLRPYLEKMISLVGQSLEKPYNVVTIS